MQINKICCIGAGYVGGPTMAVIALKCPEIKVTVVDLDENKINNWNDSSFENLPIYEPGLKDIIIKTRGKNLFFSSEIDKAIDESQIIFMAVSTPTKTYGEGKGMAADLTFVESCARQIAKASKNDKIVVEKSTLPVRTAEKIKEVLFENNRKVNFEVISNPEFLAEGTAIQDLYKSDRVLIGGENTKSGKKAVDSLVSIYKRWISADKILTTNVWSSELSKLASNAMLAQRISSINSLSALCEKTGADIKEVSFAVGKDSRIGPKFLNSSIGFGGSCFKKDILNLVYIAKTYNLDEVAEYWLGVLKINDYQKTRFTKKIINDLFKTVNKKIITIFGWAFKKDTNDSRESASIEVANYLLEEGAIIHVYDPKVNEKRIHDDIKEISNKNQENEISLNSKIKRIKCFKKPYESTINSHALCILTEWDEFKEYDYVKIYNNMHKPCFIFDGRKILDKNELKKIGFNSYEIGL